MEVPNFCVNFVPYIWESIEEIESTSEALKKNIAINHRIYEEKCMK